MWDEIITLHSLKRPIFTSFGSMEDVKQEVYVAAVRVYDGYTNVGLKEKVPFFGVGMQYIRFAREKPELYRLLFLTQTQNREYSTMKSMQHLQIYKGNLWLCSRYTCQ